MLTLMLMLMFMLMLMLTFDAPGAPHARQVTWTKPFTILSSSSLDITLLCSSPSSPYHPALHLHTAQSPPKLRPGLCIGYAPSIPPPEHAVEAQLTTSTLTCWTIFTRICPP